jgi:hypothetical protein
MKRTPERPLYPDAQTNAYICWLEERLAAILVTKPIERPIEHQIEFGGSGGYYYDTRDVDPILDSRDQTIAALRQDNAAKDARIAKLQNRLDSLPKMKACESGSP